MSHRFPTRVLLRLPVAALLGLALATTADAADGPRRKSGLWEIKTAMEGMPAGMGAMQMCVDEKSDDVTRQQAAAETRQKCSKNEVRSEGDRTLVHSVCTFDKVTATTDAVFTGRFDSGYRAEMRTTYEPPMMGRKEQKMTMEAKWLGPCKAGQKPGDVMINGMNFNPAAMRGQRHQ